MTIAVDLGHKANKQTNMANMATMPIYGKNSLNLFISGTERPLALGLGM